MKKYLFVVFLLLASNTALALNLSNAIDTLERKWADVYYSKSGAKYPARYQSLENEADLIAKQFPNQPEPLLWQAIIMASSADELPPIEALVEINHARDLLTKVIEMTPDGVNGSALVTLGTMYYMAPAWPVSFGDNHKAKALLTKALKVNPQSIEANYFYGDFLLSQNLPEQAAVYFKKALSAPVRKNQQHADKSLQQQASLALENAKERKLNDSKKIFLSFFSSGENASENR
jgi:hypothetical protein